jgi:hypothetical protein
MKALLEKGYRSVSLACLEEVLEMLFPMMRAEGVPEPARGYNSEHLKVFLAKKELFLPSFFGSKFSLDPPEYVVTYMWLGTTLRELLATLKRVLRGRADAGITVLVWVDVCFNDQRSPQVPPLPPAVVEDPSSPPLTPNSPTIVADPRTADRRRADCRTRDGPCQRATVGIPNAGGPGSHRSAARVLSRAPAASRARAPARGWPSAATI